MHYIDTDDSAGRRISVDHNGDWFGDVIVSWIETTPEGEQPVSVKMPAEVFLRVGVVAAQKYIQDIQDAITRTLEQLPYIGERHAPSQRPVLRPLHGAADMAAKCQPLRDHMVDVALRAGVDPLRLSRVLEDDLFHWSAWENDFAAGPMVLRRMIWAQEHSGE